MFLHLSVILLTGGLSGERPLQADTPQVGPLGRDTPRQTPLWEDTPLGRYPSLGRYVSY